MYLSNKKVRSLNEQLAGAIINVYETEAGKFSYRPIRDEEHRIATGEFIRLQATRANLECQSGRMPEVKTKYGYLCLLRVITAPRKHRTKIGRELLFNVADEDINAALSQKVK